MMTKPTCIHISTLHEESTVHIVWESVAGADEYELDAHYDDDFGIASTGKAWADIDISGLSTADIEALNLTWERIAKLPAQGKSWRNIEFHSPSWNEIVASNLSWSEFQKLPVEFIEFKGVGEKIPGPDQGLSWMNISSSGLNWFEVDILGWDWETFMFQPSIGINWAQIQSENMDWNEIEANGKTWHNFERQAARGLGWGSLDGRFFDWSGIEAKDLSWKLFENQPADNKTHILYNVDIPLYKKQAIFRVRTYKYNEYCDYLTSSLSNIIPVFYRDDNISFSVVEGQRYVFQLCTRGIKSFRNIGMTLKYPPSLLLLDRFYNDIQSGQRKSHDSQVLRGKNYLYRHRHWRRVDKNILIRGVK